MKVENNQAWVRPLSQSKQARALWGLSRRHIGNMVQGVSNGFTVDLEIQGVGFRANADKQYLTISLGFSHEIKYAIPEGIEIKVDKQTAVTISGKDKRLVGQVASEIRELRKPEPYKGKGVRYKDEYVRRKEGKKK
ncbi:MAG: 50S ribosomal protein L6 [Alphaproteobacteria bacterium]